MGTDLSVSTASAALKVYYSNQRVQDMMYKDNPLYALLPKYKDFYGASYPLPFRVTLPQGRSSTFTNAQSQKTPSVYKAFSLTRAKDYALAGIDSESWMASQTNPGAFLRLATNEINGALEALKRSLSWACYGDSSGTLGVAAGAGTSANPTVITLTNADDIVKFEVNQTIEVRTAGALTHTFDGTAHSGVISAVDRNAGTITVNIDNSGAGGTIAANDTFNVVGDFNAKLTGLLGWVPSTAPTSTAFFGVDRTADSSRMGGVRVTSTGKPLDEAYVDAARRIGREGGMPDYGFLSFTKYAALEKTLGSRVIYDDVEVAGVGFRGIKISGPNRPITIIADKDCPQNNGFLLTMETWGLYSLEEPVQILDLDGQKILRESSADAYEVRCASFSQMGCDAPGYNAIMLF
jgi:hypothetical protein